MTAQEFTDIYTPLADQLYQVAFHLLESSADAQDAVQDLYVKLWTMRDALDSIRNPRSYCITLLRNICIDRIRRARHDAGPVEDEDVIYGDAGAQETLEMKEKIRIVERAISQLPPAQQTVLRMRVFEELSYEEIRQRKGIDGLTSRVLLSRARGKLKRYL